VPQVNISVVEIEVVVFNQLNLLRWWRIDYHEHALAAALLHVHIGSRRGGEVQHLGGELAYIQVSVAPAEVYSVFAGNVAHPKVGDLLSDKIAEGL
jgi:hypothetical protein